MESCHALGSAVAYRNSDPANSVDRFLHRPSLIAASGYREMVPPFLPPLVEYPSFDERASRLV